MNSNAVVHIISLVAILFYRSRICVTAVVVVSNGRCKITYGSIKRQSIHSNEWNEWGGCRSIRNDCDLRKNAFKNLPSGRAPNDHMKSRNVKTFT